MEYDREKSDPPGWTSCYLGSVYVDVGQNDDAKERRKLAWEEWDRVARHGFLAAVEMFRAFARDQELSESEALAIEIACQIIEDRAPPKGAA